MKSQRSRKRKRAAQEPQDEGPKQPHQEEQLAAVVKEEELGSDGEDCEIHIQSRHVIRALRNVIGTYHGLDFTTKAVSIREPPRCLFHYQDELRRHAQESNNAQEESHMRLCLQYMEKTFHREIEIANLSDLPELEHRDLWIAFKPGCLVYRKAEGGIEVLRRLRAIWEKMDKQEKFKSWKLSMESIQYKGKDVGFMHYEIEIERYSGCKPVCKVDVVPLRLHPEEERIRCDLLKRGRKYLSLWGIHHRSLNGVARMKRVLESKHRQNKVWVKGRIMLDLEQFQLTNQGDSHSFVAGTKIFTSGSEANAELSDEDIMTCYYSIPGYSLEIKLWGTFLVKDVTEVAYDDNAFHGLVLQEQSKRLISSLLEMKDCQQEDGFDDLIQGKGKGLISLLHGPPGVGKTYTAESIADHTRRPLLRAHAADVYGDGGVVEERMSELFLLAAKWNGILLLDEADVYMQDRRASPNVHQNQLISTLLRILEYYEGILFLTTNRHHTIDPAFVSRIHLSIAYPALSADARREIWISFTTRANRGQRPDWLSTKFLDYLAEQDVNGREIKNIVRVGYSLSRSARRDMSTEDLLQGISATKQTKTDFGHASKEEEVKEVTEEEEAPKVTEATTG
ncbi:MAG: hypothetical protein Q9172_004560 [Xanthocarpia lactea]